MTTFGYGDVTPENTAGRLVGALFLLEAISFVTIVTAVITSSLVERAVGSDRRLRDHGAVGEEELIAQLAEITSRLIGSSRPSTPEGHREPRSDKRRPPSGQCLARGGDDLQQSRRTDRRLDRLAQLGTWGEAAIEDPSPVHGGLAPETFAPPSRQWGSLSDCEGKARVAGQTIARTGC